MLSNKYKLNKPKAIATGFRVLKCAEPECKNMVGYRFPVDKPGDSDLKMSCRAHPNSNPRFFRNGIKCNMMPDDTIDLTTEEDASALVIQRPAPLIVEPTPVVEATPVVEVPTVVEVTPVVESGRIEPEPTSPSGYGPDSPNYHTTSPNYGPNSPNYDPTEPVVKPMLKPLNDDAYDPDLEEKKARVSVPWSDMIRKLVNVENRITNRIVELANQKSKLKKARLDSTKWYGQRKRQHKFTQFKKRALKKKDL